MKKIGIFSGIALCVALAGGVEARAQTNDEKAERSVEPQDTEAADNAAQEKLVTPEGLSDALSCRSHEAAMAFAMSLFVAYKPIEWMHKIEGTDKDDSTKGMLGLYGFKLSRPVSLLGEPVDSVYFMKDWVVTLMSRDKAEAFIKAHELKRAPIRMTEQYYHFVDPEAGPMIGAFEPTGNATAAMLAMAFGAKRPPSPPSETLFVGCNYAPASEAEFLQAATQADGMMKGAAKDVGESVGAKP